MTLSNKSPTGIESFYPVLCSFVPFSSTQTHTFKFQPQLSRPSMNPSISIPVQYSFLLNSWHFSSELYFTSMFFYFLKFLNCYLTYLSVSFFLTNMPANLENSAVATALEIISFHSNTKERQFQKNIHTLAK